jgi:hypothetical protein
MTTVVHCRREQFDVYIGRDCVEYAASKWANPFRIGPDGTRKEVVAKYRNWIIMQVDLMACLHELKDKRLGCWCHPKECHGDLLAAMVNVLLIC